MATTTDLADTMCALHKKMATTTTLADTRCALRPHNRGDDGMASKMASECDRDVLMPLVVRAYAYV